MHCYFCQSETIYLMLESWQDPIILYYVGVVSKWNNIILRSFYYDGDIVIRFAL